MSIKVSIVVELHISAKRNPFNLKTIEIKLDKPDFFKFAIFQLEVLPHIRDSDFDYLQSKIPSMEGLYGDYLELTNDTIINHCTEDTMIQTISELAGVAVGLKYATLLLEVDLSKFSKVGRPIKGKYMDYSVTVDSKLYEIETKGTTQRYFSEMVNDIIDKKKASAAYLKFGTVATLKGKIHSQISKCIVVDDPPEDKAPVEAHYFRNQLSYYAIFLSFILDSKYYNYFIKRIRNNESSRSSIVAQKFYAAYQFNGKRYFGECFDYRLTRSNLDSVPKQQLENVPSAFRYLTEKVGKTKFFVGLDEEVVNAINKSDKFFMENYVSERIIEDNDNEYRFLDTDGILIVKSRNGDNVQLEKIFGEEEVQRRIGLYGNYIRGYAHDCGAPCESPGIEGKPCKIRTYRTFCHWHR